MNYPDGGGFSEDRSKSVRSNASKDVVGLLLHDVAKQMAYRAVVFWDLVLTGFANMGVVIVLFVLILDPDLEFYRILAISVISIRSGLLLGLIVPYIVYAADIDTVTDPEDKKTLKRYRESPEFRNSPCLYTEPGYLYDNREFQNRRAIPPLISFVIIYAFVVILILARYYHLSHSSDLSCLPGDPESSGCDGNAQRHFYSGLLPLLGGLAAGFTYESYLITKGVHHFYRGAIMHSDIS